MAQTIRTICDVHDAKGVEVDGITWQVLIRKQGQRTQQRDVDLCPECSQGLEAVSAFVVELGRTDGQTAPRRAVASTAASNGNGSDSVACPECGNSLTRGNLARHLRQVHAMGDTAVAQALGGTPSADGAVKAYPCPDCDFSSAAAAGLGAHRHAKHGYRASSHKAASV